MQPDSKQEEIKKGKVFIQTSTGIVSFNKLQQSEIKKDSKQIKSKSKYMTENGLVTPPYAPEVFLTLYESNPIFWRCVNQIAIDTAGLGWSLQLKEDAKESKKELKRLNKFLKKPNNEETLRGIWKKLLIDWGTIGWFGIEVVRNNKAEVDSIYHIPAHTIRIHQDKEKFCQIRNNKKVWFKKFGSRKNIASKSGKEGGRLSVRVRANEIIYYKNFYPKSDYYGVTNAISAIGDIFGLIGQRDYNLAFFENYGVPSAVVILEGEWEPDSEKTVSKFINKELSGTTNPHRTLVVTQPDNCKFTYMPLESKTSGRDGSFRLYSQTCRDDILIAFSMPPERIGIRITGSLGGNVAEEAIHTYINGVVEPLQADLEDIVNNMLISSDVYEFKFNNLDMRDLDAEVKRGGEQISSGVKTPNEVRNDLGLKPYSNGDKFFIASNLIETGEPDEPLSKIEQSFFDEEV